MNRYGRLAYDFTSQHRPRSFALMTDPIGHFSRLGEEVEARITQLWDQLLGRQRPGESLEDYRQRSYQARRQAEEVILTEEIWSEPEETTGDEDDEQISAYRSQMALISETLVRAARTWTDEPEDEPQA
ncbi:MAG TPA: hypothetical protein VM142_07580 [Acidimicrobiales bacterium]|nr:hypothetical protein [Acidimicrobiales bacterium]